MKLYLYTAFASAITLTASANFIPGEYDQCTVDFPDGTRSGICLKVANSKYIQFYTCEGKMVAYIQPGYLKTTYEATCGNTHVGFPGDKDKNGPSNAK